VVIKKYQFGVVDNSTVFIWMSMFCWPCISV